MDTKTEMDIETVDDNRKTSFKDRMKRSVSRYMAVAGGIATVIIAQMATVPKASAEINASTFEPITNLIDAVIPLFSSILDLIIAVFPLVIAMAFLGGLAYLINKIFDGALNFDFKRKR